MTILFSVVTTRSTRMSKKPSFMGLLKMGIVSTTCALTVIARATIKSKREDVVSKMTETAVGSIWMRWERRHTIASTNSYEERLHASMCRRWNKRSRPCLYDCPSQCLPPSTQSSSSFSPMYNTLSCLTPRQLHNRQHD